MANKSIYETSFAAGQTGGVYEAELQGVGDVWSDIESSRAMTATKGERRERTLDTILAATELTSQVAGGFEARKEFKSSLEQVGANIDKGAAVKVGKGGQAWSELNPLEKLFQRPEYKFGDNIQMSRADITTAGQMLQYGGKPDYTRFKPESMSEEVGGFYGERKGFDIGDIVGEKSVLAAGKRKLSSVLSSAGEKLPSIKPKKEPQAGQGTVLRDDIDEEKEIDQVQSEPVAGVLGEGTVLRPRDEDDENENNISEFYNPSW